MYQAIVSQIGSLVDFIRLPGSLRAPSPTIIPEAAQAGLRLPMLAVDGKPLVERPLGLAAEPGCTLMDAAHMAVGDKAGHAERNPANQQGPPVVLH